MSPDQLSALRAFFTTAETRLPDIVALMYDRFLKAMPETAPLFKGDMQEQHRQFTLMLWSIVRLTRSSELWPVNAWTGEAPIPAVEKLGMRHAHVGVRPEHFETMKVVLSRCFREMFPKDFTPPVEKALAFIFDVLSHATTGSEGNNRQGRMTRKAVANKSYLDGPRPGHSFYEGRQDLSASPLRRHLKLT
jgi:hemoglobin-like flavoprotein